MPMIRFLRALLVVGVVGSAAQPLSKPPKARVIVNKKYKFSVVRPDSWYVYLGADLPSFYNFGADKMLSQGERPPGGAEIWVHVGIAGQPSEPGDLSHWVGKIVIVDHGSNAKEQAIQGPGSEGLEVTFDQLPLGIPGDTQKKVVLAWQTRDKMYAVELTYYDGDPRAEEYRRVLVDLMRSFQLN